MRLIKRLLVSGEDVPLAAEDIRLDIDRPGRAVFQVRATQALSGPVTFALGWNFDDAMTLFFSGDVERCTPVDASQQRLFCREVTARLDASIPLALRHPTLRDVVAAYADATGLSFIVPDKAYASTKVPAFYGLGSGFHGMATLGDVFGITDYLWQAQGDGQVFVGSWGDSRWAKAGVTIPATYFAKATATSRSIAAIPGLRPGVLLNGERVASVRMSGHQMEVVCKTQ
ncbi:hypothetical protein dsx2_2512 [Desulfovibrio sp. X2]|uniref:hypothetical protein n=1 Tax=Desulfovibrio sp. X2 TaxID=941449 RepID=UPI000358B3D8|nr:hypothetical protein [Desulfovibrio sp. X2]EPR43152.1 hypothetical protein dsx2_2512 [Desulfovibrio sp. X2]